jgi:amino acid permease
MIGAGILNLPLIFKTFGIVGGVILTLVLAFFCNNSSLLFRKMQRYNSKI